MFREPKNRNDLTGLFKKFITKAKQRGTVLLAVCKGKVAEGIDFSDELCWAVFIIGIPYPPMGEDKIVLKRKYLDEIKKNMGLKLLKKR